MITIEKAQKLADLYSVKVLDVETRHDCVRNGKIADYIMLNVSVDDTEQVVYIYFGSEFQLVEDKEFYIECKVKNALYGVM